MQRARLVRTIIAPFKWIAVVLGVLLMLMAGYIAYVQNIANDRVAEELRADPFGAQANRVMLMSLPGGRGNLLAPVRERAF